MTRPVPVLAFLLGSLAWPCGAQVPARTLFSSDFELDTLEDPAQSAITDPVYLRAWRQQFLDSRHPRFMVAAVAAGAPEGARHLSLPLRGARALLVTEEEFPLLPGQRLELRALARWDPLGTGRWGMRVQVTGGESYSLFEGSGESPAWAEIAGSFAIPAGAERGRVEIWLESEPGSRAGALGIDAIEIRAVPQLTWNFRGALRRIGVEDEHPLALRSVGYPADSYQLEFQVIDLVGAVRFGESKTLLVNEEFPIDYSPHLPWAFHDLPRGLYEIALHVRAASGWDWKEVRRIALAGTPEFERRAGGVAWGFEIDAYETEPEWLAPLAPDRILVEIPAAMATGAAGAPRWLVTNPSREPALLIDPERGWGKEEIERLEPLLPELYTWYLRAGPRAAPVRTAFASHKERAPYLRVAAVHPRGQEHDAAPHDIVTAPEAGARALLDFGPRSGPWSARVELGSTPIGDRSRELARALYLLVARAPAAIYLVHPETTLLDRLADGDLAASETLLVWEYVTGFLSGAEYVAAEPWDPDGHCLSFRRDGEEYLVVLCDGAPHTLLLPGGAGASGRDPFGTHVHLDADAEGRESIPVSRSPLLVRGLDFARLRTVESLRARGDDIRGRVEEQPVVLELTNHYPGAVRVALELRAPRDWEVDLGLEPRRVDAGKSAAWPLRVKVPPWFGIEGESRLEGIVRIETPAGATVASPVAIDVPMESPLVEIRALGVGTSDADILVRNRTGAPLPMHVYLLARPQGIERTWIDQELPPGAERTFHIRYPTPPDELWVGVTLPRHHSYVNKLVQVEAK